jgi:RHS repeat-associated protein
VSYASNSLNQYTAITEDQNPPFNPTYDDDGNTLTMSLSTGAWTATWNCENRMVAIERGTGILPVRLEFAYDYMGRRVEKMVYSGSPGNWTLDSHLRFVYNGYRLAQTLDALSDPANAIVQEFAWSLDDELRLVRDGEDIYFVHHDANRNVTELTDATGTLAAHYEYAPFGKLTAQSGPYATTNPFRFSSEYFDAETGLVYYNFRYYSPELGRWMSRDPIEEDGGIGLFLSYNNDPINRTDQLGLLSPQAALWAAIAGALTLLSEENMKNCEEMCSKEECDDCCSTLTKGALAGMTSVFLIAEAGCLELVNPILILTCHTGCTYIYKKGLEDLIDKSSNCHMRCVNKQCKNKDGK